MTSRQTDKVTRVDVRILKELYERISELAVNQFHAKIHHRSGKPEVTPTILKLIKLGIAHLESTLPDIDETDTELKEQVRDLDTRLKKVEAKLSGVETVIAAEPEPSTDEGLTDSELSSLINLSSVLIYRYRRDGKANPNVVERLKDWEVRGELWVRKSEE